MKIEDKYLDFNLKIQNQLKEKLEKIRKGESKHEFHQIYHILQEVKRMETEKGLTPYYPRIIVDSWDYNDVLGMDLLKLVNLYKGLR